MEISFENNVDDIIALTRRTLETNSTYKRGRISYIYGSPLLILLIFTVYAYVGKQPAYITGGIVAAVFSFVWYWYFYRNYPRKAVEKMQKDKPQKDVFCRHEVTITPEGIAERTAETQSFQKWSALLEITYTPEHIFLFTTPATAHVIPLRELGSSLFQQVGDEIRTYSKPNTPLEPSC